MTDFMFRAWDKEKKVYTHALWINGNGTIRVSIDGHPDKFHCLENKKYSDRYIIEQYIGLRDRNGKEIYEGDIIQWDDSDFIGNGGIGSVWRSEESGNFCHGWRETRGGKDTGIFGMPKRFFGMVEMEIVGNIHNNLEKAPWLKS